MNQCIAMLALAIIALASCPCVGNAATASTKPSQAAPKKTEVAPLHDEADKSDVFAIPLDNSEMDEESENNNK